MAESVASGARVVGALNLRRTLPDQVERFVNVFVEALELPQAGDRRNSIRGGGVVLRLDFVAVGTRKGSQHALATRTPGLCGSTGRTRATTRARERLGQEFLTGVEGSSLDNGRKDAIAGIREQSVDGVAYFRRKFGKFGSRHRDWRGRIGRVGTSSQELLHLLFGFLDDGNEQDREPAIADVMNDQRMVNPSPSSASKTHLKMYWTSRIYK